MHKRFETGEDLSLIGITVVTHIITQVITAIEHFP